MSPAPPQPAFVVSPGANPRASTTHDAHSRARRIRWRPLSRHALGPGALDEGGEVFEEVAREAVLLADAPAGDVGLHGGTGFLGHAVNRAVDSGQVGVRQLEAARLGRDLLGGTLGPLHQYAEDVEILVHDDQDRDRQVPVLARVEGVEVAVLIPAEDAHLDGRYLAREPGDDRDELRRVPTPVLGQNEDSQRFPAEDLALGRGNLRPLDILQIPLAVLLHPGDVVVDARGLGPTLGCQHGSLLNLCRAHWGCSWTSPPLMSNAAARGVFPRGRLSPC